MALLLCEAPQSSDLVPVSDARPFSQKGRSSAGAVQAHSTPCSRSSGRGTPHLRVGRVLVLRCLRWRLRRQQCIRIFSRVTCAVLASLFMVISILSIFGSSGSSRSGHVLALEGLVWWWRRVVAFEFFGRTKAMRKSGPWFKLGVLATR